MGRNHPGITEKRLNNKRFCKTEEAILKAFFDYDNYISVGKMTERAGVARSTFYHHHKAVNRIVIDYRNYLLDKYSYIVKKILIAKDISAKSIYERMLIFILQNKKIFKVLMMGNEHEIFVRMIIKMKPKLIKIMRLPKNSEKIFLVYTSEVNALINTWCKSETYEQGVDELLNEIIYLTETARIRLRMLLN